MRHYGARAALVVLAVFLGSVAAPRASANHGAGKTNPFVTIVSGTQSPDAPDTVDGAIATQAPGAFQQGAESSAGPAPAGGKIIAPLAPGGCLNAGVNWQAAYDVFGVTVWKIWNHTHWCFSSWQVTSVTGWTDTYTAPGWTSSSISWNWAWWSYPATARSTSHAHFCLAAFYGCIQTADPNVNTWVNGAGNYSFDDSNWYPGS